MNQKGFSSSLVIVLAIVIIAGVAGYFVFFKKSQPIIQQSTPTPANTGTSIPKDETANWKIFRNERFGYELQLPAEWVVMAPPEDGSTELCTTELEVTKNSSVIVIAKKQLDLCGFFVHSVPSDEAEIAISIWPGRISDLTTILEPPHELTTVAGENAVMYRFSYQQARPNVNATRIYFNHGNNQYLIFLKNQNPQGTSYDPIYDQILSTFLFRR